MVDKIEMMNDEANLETDDQEKVRDDLFHSVSKVRFVCMDIYYAFSLALVGGKIEYSLLL